MSLRNEVSLDVNNIYRHYGNVSLVDYVIAKVGGFPLEELRKKNRKHERVMVRKLWSYLLVNHTDKSNSFIGPHVGNKDHSTVYHHLKDVTFMVQNPEFLGTKTEKNIVNIIRQFDEIKRKYYEEIGFIRRGTTYRNFTALREKISRGRRVEITNSIMREHGKKAIGIRSRNLSNRVHYVKSLEQKDRMRKRSKSKNKNVKV